MEHLKVDHRGTVNIPHLCHTPGSINRNFSYIIRGRPQTDNQNITATTPCEYSGDLFILCWHSPADITASM